MNIDAKISQPERDIASIKSRNKKVEADKAWETSTARKVAISLITYLLISLYMIYLEVSSPWLNALVPMFGYLLSTLTLSQLKSYWQSSQSKNDSI